MTHPAYSPDPASSDYYLFWCLAHFLHLWCFKNKHEVEASVKELFVSKDKNWYQYDIIELAERCLQMVQHYDLYIEYKADFVVTWRIK